MFLAVVVNSNPSLDTCLILLVFWEYKGTVPQEVEEYSPKSHFHSLSLDLIPECRTYNVSILFQLDDDLDSQRS